MNKEELALAKEIEEALVSSGAHERFKQLLRARLEESGWCEMVRVEAEGTLRVILLINAPRLFLPQTCFYQSG